MPPIVQPPDAARQWGARASAGVARTTLRRDAYPVVPSEADGSAEGMLTILGS
jgi:hypothetical protein